MVIGSKQELGLLMKEVEQAKNRYSNRSGFAPVQRQIGQRPRIPNAILFDNVVDPALVDGMCVDDMERLHKMRRVAQRQGGGPVCSASQAKGVERVSSGRSGLCVPSARLEVQKSSRLEPTSPPGGAPAPSLHQTVPISGSLC